MPGLYASVSQGSQLGPERLRPSRSKETPSESSLDDEGAIDNSPPLFCIAAADRHLDRIAPYESAVGPAYYIDRSRLDPQRDGGKWSRRREKAVANTQISTIVFDLYDTLVPGPSSAARALLLHEVAGQLGADPGRFLRVFDDSRRERFDGTWRTSESMLASIAVRAGARFPASERIRAAAHKRRAQLKELHEHASVETVAWFRDRGLRVALLSNCSPETPEIWPSGPLRNVVERAFFSCAIGTVKPSATAYKIVCDSLSVAPAECLFIGDGGDSEIQGAVDAGFAAIRVARTETVMGNVKSTQNTISLDMLPEYVVGTHALKSSG